MIEGCNEGCMDIQVYIGVGSLHHFSLLIEESCYGPQTTKPGTARKRAP